MHDPSTFFMRTSFHTLSPLRYLVIGVLLLVSIAAEVLADPGKEEIGRLKVTLYLGSDDENVDAGENAKKVDPAELSKLTSFKSLKFKTYHKLGSDEAGFMRSYENWLTPLQPSKALMMSYEAVGKPTGKSIRLDLNLWQKSEKVMKIATTTLTLGKPLYIRGPKWRGGYLIKAVELVSLK